MPEPQEHAAKIRQKVEARLPGVHKILSDMRDSGDPDRIADGAFLLGMLDEMSDYVALLREAMTEAMESLATGPMKDGYAYSVLEEATS